MKKSLVLVGLVGALVLGGCGEEKTKTVEYYMLDENAAELQTKLKECGDNPGELGLTPNCINAARADLHKRNMKEDTTRW
jgi:hypothetical protein